MIDTGKCIDILTFQISKIDTFQTVMLRSIEFCNLIFEKNIVLILDNTQVNFKDLELSNSRLFSYKDLQNVNKDCISFNRASYLGIFKIWYKRLYENIEE